MNKKFNKIKAEIPSHSIDRVDKKLDTMVVKLNKDIIDSDLRVVGQLFFGIGFSVFTTNILFAITGANIEYSGIVCSVPLSIVVIHSAFKLFIRRNKIKKNHTKEVEDYLQYETEKISKEIFKDVDVCKSCETKSDCKNESCSKKISKEIFKDIDICKSCETKSDCKNQSCFGKVDK